MNKFSEAAKKSIRRKKRAKRLWKKTPLFAYETLLAENPGYSLDVFTLDVLGKKRPKRKRGKSLLPKYGRWNKFQELLKAYNNSKNPEFYFAAKKLRDNMTKPYRLLVHYVGEDSKEFNFDPFTRYDEIVEINQMAKSCKTMSEFENLLRQIKERTNRYGGL